MHCDTIITHSVNPIIKLIPK